MKKIWKVLVGAVIGLYVLACALLFIFEARLIFLPPDFVSSATPADANLAFEDLHIPVDASTQIHAWWIPAAQPTRAVILFFHGNGYDLEGEARLEAPMLHQTGANVLAVDYRGYGRSSPLHPDGPSTEADARAALRYLEDERQVQLSDIFIVGRSIGTGVATQLATDAPHAAGLILVSPITSVPEAANELWLYRYVFRPVQWLGHRNDFNNAAKISSVAMPVLIITGTRDELATPAMAKILYDRVHEPKTLRWIEGAGHNDILEVGDGTLLSDLQSFVAENIPHDPRDLVSPDPNSKILPRP